MKPILLAMAVILAVVLPAAAQQFSFDAFVGTWEGIISNDQTFGYEDPITLEIQADGVYYDSTGRLMPPLYEDTQVCSYDPVTNRVRFRYLDIVYAGQYFYTNIYFEVVSYTGDTLELHWNFWDDPVPHPEVQTIAVTRAGVTAAPGDVVAADALALASFPNPFNPRTTVSFELPRDMAATLTVHDLRGRQVATLVQGVLPAGRHERDFDATGLPAGAYLYTLRAGDLTRTGRMTLVK